MKAVYSVALAICMSLPHVLLAQDDLDNYIKRLKGDYAGARKETGFLSAGSDFLYAQEYFDAKNYSSSEWYYKDVLRKEQDNPYANYQLGIAMLRQNDPGKKETALAYLETAFKLNPSLKTRYKKDMSQESLANGQVAAADATPPLMNQPANTNASVANKNEQGLSAYIDRIKKSAATGGKETAMLSAGRSALYGIENYEKNEFYSAATDFRLSLAVEADNPYVNYMLAVSLAAQGKTGEANPFLQKAFAADANLKQQYENDLPKAQAAWAKIEDAKKIKTTPATKIKYGGKLAFGNYTCHQTVYNGPNANPAFSYQYKGYFQLKADGTYRWLDDGVTGKYKYDPNTGTITWLSGYFKNNPKSTKYRINEKTAQMTVSFTDTYRWECGCNQL